MELSINYLVIHRVFTNVEIQMWVSTVIGSL